MTKKVPASALVVAAAVVLFLADVLFAGQTFYLRDVIFDSLPWRRFGASVLAQGEIPLWNPHSRFGQPFLANPQSAVLYPPHLLFVLLPAGWAFKANLLFHLLLSGVSMAALLRRFELHHGAAAFGGIVWTLGGYMTANLEFMSVMETLAWSPLIVLLAVRLADAAAAERPLRPLVVRGALLAVVIAVTFLAGQVQPLAYSVLIAFFFMGIAIRTGETPWWTFGTPREWKRCKSAGLTFAAAVACAAGLAAVQWMPTRELLPLSIRTAVDPGLDLASAHPRHLLHLLDPLASGRPGAETWNGGTLFEFWLGSIYIGLLPLALAAAAFVPRRGTGPVHALPVVGGVTLVWGLLLALGRHTPLYGLLLDVVPGFDLFRWPAKSFQLVAFALSVLAAAGLDGVLSRRDSEPSKRLGPAFAAAAVVLVGAAALLLSGVSESPRPLVVAVVAVAAVVALRTRRVPVQAALAAALVLVVADLAVVSRDIHLVDDDAILDAVPADVPDVGDARVHTEYTFAQFAMYGSRDANEYRAAVDVFAGDTGLSTGVDRTYGGDALQVARARDVTNLLDSLPPEQRRRLAAALGVEAVLGGPSFDAVRTGREQAEWARWPAGFERARIVGSWTTADDDVAAMERMLSPGFDPRRSAVIGVLGVAPPTPGPVGARVERASFEREMVEVDVDVTRRALLVVSDTHFPGWVTRVDGVERDIVPVNVIFRGVVLEPGDREVRMTYEPRSFSAGLRWSGFTVVALLAVLAAVLLPRRRSPVSAAD